MKKTCYKCKAISGDRQGSTHFGCMLNYKTDRNGKPLEECPKPLTLHDLNRLIRAQQERDYVK